MVACVQLRAVMYIRVFNRCACAYGCACSCVCGSTRACAPMACECYECMYACHTHARQTSLTHSAGFAQGVSTSIFSETASLFSTDAYKKPAPEEKRVCVQVHTQAHWGGGKGVCGRHTTRTSPSYYLSPSSLILAIKVLLSYMHRHMHV